jgi:hypothetical protein
MAIYLLVVGLLLTGIGAGIGAWAMWFTDKQAIEVGATRWAGSSDEENIQLPAVQNLLRQSRFASRGFAMIAAGTILQIVGTLIQAGS